MKNKEYRKQKKFWVYYPKEWHGSVSKLYWTDNRYMESLLPVGCERISYQTAVNLCLFNEYRVAELVEPAYLSDVFVHPSDWDDNYMNYTLVGRKFQRIEND